MTAPVLVAEIEYPGGGTVYASTKPYATHAADTPANAFFVRAALDAVYERALSFEAWARAGGANAISSIDLVNVDGALDAWLGLNWKDKTAVLKSVMPGAAYSTAEEVGALVIQDIKVPSNSRIRLECGSTMARIAKPITRVYSQSIPNEQLRGQARPMVLGRVRWCEPRAKRLYSVSLRALYDVTDDVYESIMELRHRAQLQTEAESPLVAAGYFFADQDECNGFIFRDQAHRFAAEVRGNVIRGANIATNPTFPTGTGGVPDGWDVVEDGGTVTWNAAGSVTIDAEGTDEVRIEQDLTIATDTVYQAVIAITSSTGVATLLLSDGATLHNIRSFDTVVARVVVATFTGVAARDKVGFGFRAGASGNVTISALHVYPCERIDSLENVLRFVVGRLGVSESVLDLTAAAAIDTAAGYRLAIATNAELTGETLVRRAALSFGAGLFQDRFSKLRAARMAAPATTADFEIAEWQVKGGVGFEADRAPGLTKRMNYGRNYVKHSDDDMSGLTDQGLRAELSREVQTVTTTVTLHAMYSDAEGREPFESLLSEQADAQDEIDRICGLYTVPRGFYTLRVRLDDLATAYTIEPGDTVKLTHRRYGLSSGRNLLVVLARSNFTIRAVDLVLWGAS